MSDRAQEAPEAPPEAWLLLPAAGPPPRVFGLSLVERLSRSLGSAGMPGAWRLAPGDPAPEASRHRVLLLRGDCLLDARLVGALSAEIGSALLSQSPGSRPGGRAVGACVPADRAGEVRRWLQAGGDVGRMPAGLRAATPAQLVPSYSAALRKSEPPFAIDASDAAQPFDARAVEEHLFRASYKGLTDLVTKWLWPRPALAAVRRLARWRVHPNSVTALSWGIALTTPWLFVQGSYGLGLLFAWLMTFLDTVDGKLARCTLTSSRIGNVLDHGLDLIHPPLWWLSYGAGLGPGHGVATGIAVAGYFLGRLQEGLFLLLYGIEIHTWRPLDGVVRTITARRNPNLLLFSVGVLGGRPDLGLAMVAGWTVVCFAFHSARIGQAWWHHRAGQPIRPWDEAVPAPPRPNPGPVQRSREVPQVR